MLEYDTNMTSKYICFESLNKFRSHIFGLQRKTQNSLEKKQLTIYPVSMWFPDTLASPFLFSLDLIFLCCSQLLVYVAGGPSSGSDRGPPFSSTPLFLLIPLPMNKPERSGGFREQSISKASRLMKLAIANPSIISSSQETDSRFLRRGGRCLVPGKPGLHSPLLARSSESLQSSWSEAEDGDEALCSARSALLRRRSRSRCERERRLCLKPPLRLEPSMSMSDKGT